MKKITLLLAMLFSVITFAQVFPTISDESSETWYYIQFERAGGGNQGVIQDMGDGQNLLTMQARENTDSQLWKVTETETEGKYVITNKLGRSIDYSANRYIASVTTSITITIENDNNNTFEGLELRRNEEARLMNQSGGGGFNRQLAEYNYGDGGNVLNFRLPEDVVGGLEPALVSSLPVQGTSYHIKFRNGNAVLKDMGAGNPLQTALPVQGDDSQLWKISGTSADYTLTSNLGNTIDFVDGNFTSNSSESTIKINLVVNLPGFEIQRVGSSRAMNQAGGAGIGKQLAEWNIGDVNNPVDFVEPKDVVYTPKLSSGSEEFWYYIQFNSGLAAIADQGEDVAVLTEEASAENDGQLWKLIGTDAAFTLTNKASGRTMNYSTESSRITASGSTSVNFTLVPSQDGSGFNLQVEGSSRGVNQFGGAGVGKELGEYRLNDPNNILKFSPSTVGPILSAKGTVEIVSNVHPNPFNNTFSFNLKNKTSKNASIKVYSILGKVVKTDNVILNNGQGTVDGSDLLKGVYIIQIETEEGKSNFRMIKQ